AKILSVEISEMSPTDLPANISYSDSSVKLEPLLMNQNDSITIKALVSKPKDTIAVSGRIVGVKKIEEKDEETQLNARIRLLAILSLIASPIFVLIAPLRGEMRNYVTALWILDISFPVILSSVIALMLIIIWSQIRGLRAHR